MILTCFKGDRTLQRRSDLWMDRGNPMCELFVYLASKEMIEEIGGARVRQLFFGF